MNCCYYGIYSVLEDSRNTHTARMIAKILKRKTEKKTEDILGEDQFGLLKRKRN
jgi:hypothetical protein